MDVKAWLRARSLDLGFAKVGFAAVPADGARFGEGDRFAEWLERGYDGTMGYLRRTAARRIAVRAVLAEARSVMVLVWPYGDHPGPQPDEGAVARYARGRDYHNVLGKRLEKLLRQMREQWPAQRFYASVDAGAVLEKAWAVRAGIGWLGKNTLVLDAAMGSYFLLAVVLLPFPVEADPEVTDQCGSCRLCLEACPTAAFPAPYVLDARRCVSYQTIESRLAIPSDLRAGVENWVFGCDICQEVCPFNHRQSTTFDAAFGPADTPLHESLGNLLQLTDATFASTMAGRPLRRPGRDGLVRNACLVAGNSGDRRWLPALIALLADAAPLVRRHAAWAIGRLGGRAAAAALTAAAQVEQDDAVLAELHLASKDAARTVSADRGADGAAD